VFLLIGVIWSCSVVVVAVGSVWAPGSMFIVIITEMGLLLCGFTIRSAGIVCFIDFSMIWAPEVTILSVLGWGFLQSFLAAGSFFAVGPNLSALTYDIIYIDYQTQRRTVKKPYKRWIS
jgi:hypothetical protein